ncbi:FRG domain-containing protein [Bradyrhizobium sp. 40]|uniref:FRG domain-containing protein n=1 Tax=Bradyrhizobium sp. 40 TaxID=2782674 RepID=UPI001FFE9939|nr:FRG domain-containing protein [Bradyrhizobium sp. 40]UPJ40836.1 FRG domain-containing protein [Bradyrhizobium sp. 40]
MPRPTRISEISELNDWAWLRRRHFPHTNLYGQLGTAMLQGQWLGKYAGTNTGEVILELDSVDSSYGGRAYIYDDRADLPSTAAYVAIPAGVTTHQIKNLPLLALAPGGDFSTWNNVRSLFPGVTFPTTADTDWTIAGNTIKVDWLTNIGTSGSATVTRVDGSRPSKLAPMSITTWDEFRHHVRDLSPYRYVFRGQENNSWRLRTSFHRTQRADLIRYMQLDVNELHRHLSGLTTHLFNLTSDIEYAAFLSLAQHHGYPTPLLDWTYSPFISAYFAFKKAGPPVEKVRIFLFDRQQWVTDWMQLQRIAPARLHFSIIDAVALNNARKIPQQALATVTNAEDIEDYIGSKETDTRKYLQAIDLPTAQREQVLKELNLMGINAGSLFPGLDGACSQLRDRFFGL